MQESLQGYRHLTFLPPSMSLSPCQLLPLFLSSSCTDSFVPSEELISKVSPPLPHLLLDLLAAFLATKTTKLLRGKWLGPSLPWPLFLMNLCHSLSLPVSGVTYHLLIPMIAILHTNYKTLASAILLSSCISITRKQFGALKFTERANIRMAVFDIWEDGAEKKQRQLSPVTWLGDGETQRPNSSLDLPVPQAHCLFPTVYGFLYFQ